MVSIQRKANGGLYKNAGDLTPELAERVVKAVKKTPLSLKSAAYAIGIIPAELRYIIRRGSLPGADPLWVDVSVRCRRLIAAAEARNFKRLEAAAQGGQFEEKTYSHDLPEPTLKETKVKVQPASVSAQAEIQRLIEADTWQIEPGPDDAPIVYMDLFSDPAKIPPDILNALVANGWKHDLLGNAGVGSGESRQLESPPE